MGSRPSKFIVLADNMRAAINMAWEHGGPDFQSRFDKSTGQAEQMKGGGASRLITVSPISEIRVGTRLSVRCFKVSLPANGVILALEPHLPLSKMVTIRRQRLSKNLQTVCSQPHVVVL